MAIAVSFILLLLAGTAQAQWTNSGNNVFYNAGNVGIGTNGPTYKLQIVAPSLTTALGVSFNSATEQAFQITNTNTGGKTWSLGPGIGSPAGTFGIYNASDSLLGFAIDSAGKVGIGTAAPEEALHIGGNATIKIGGTYAAGFRQTFVGGVGAQLDLGEYYGNTTFIPRMTILGGNVGIGTTAPNDTLHVGGAGNFGIQIGKTWGVGIKSVWVGGIGSRMDFVEYANSDAATTRMSILGGNVGIGTTSPSTALQVNGASTISAGNVDANNVAGWRMQTWSGDSYIDNHGGHTYFRTGAGSSENAAARTVMTFDNSNGNVGIGMPPTGQYKLEVNGTINAKYQDMAEWVPSSEQIKTGTVVVLDSTKSNQVISSTQSYDTRVAGVVSEKPGIALGESGANKVLVATTGRVLVNVDATNGPIHIGDLLVTSDIAGLAMKSEPIMIGNRKMHMPGTLIGKALEPLEKGSGKILVLLSLQ